MGKGLNSGTIYRTWVVVKTNKTGDDRESILNSSLMREEAIQRAYNEAPESVNPVSCGITRKLIHSQQGTHRIAFDVLNKRKKAA